MKNEWVSRKCYADCADNALGYPHGVAQCGTMNDARQRQLAIEEGERVYQQELKRSRDYDDGIIADDDH